MSAVNRKLYFLLVYASFFTWVFPAADGTHLRKGSGVYFSESIPRAAPPRSHGECAAKKLRVLSVSRRITPHHERSDTIRDLISSSIQRDLDFYYAQQYLKLHHDHLQNKTPCGEGPCKQDFDDLVAIEQSHAYSSAQVDPYSGTTKFHTNSYPRTIARKYGPEQGCYATEYEIIRDFRQGYDQIARRIGEENELIDLGRLMLYDAEQALLLGQPSIEYVTCMRRARDILAYLDQPDTVPDALPELAERAKRLIAELDNDSARYLSDPQNVVNEGLRVEIIDCANKIAKADFYTTSYLDADLLGTLTLHTLDEVYILGEEQNFNEAYARQDEANCIGRFLHFLGQMAKSDAEALEGAGDTLLAGGGILARGMARGVMNCGANCAGIATTALTNPTQAVRDFAHYRFALPLFLGNTILRACVDSENLWEDGRTLAAAVSDYIANTPGEQLAEDSIAFITEALLFAKLRTVGGAVAKAVGGKVKGTAAYKKVKKSITDAAAKGKEGIKKAFSPSTRGVLKDTGEVTKKCGEKKGLKPLHKLKGKGAKTALVLEQHKNTAPRINLKHLFNAEKQKNGSWKGNHHLGLDENCIAELVGEVDEFGAFAAYFEKEGIRKYSHFFPTNWNRVKIIEKIKEAFFNPTELKEYGLVGVTSEGMKIEMFFKRIGSTGELYINTAYPKIGN